MLKLLRIFPPAFAGAIYASAAHGSPPIADRDVPEACTAISAQEVARTGSQSVSDALKSLPTAGSASPQGSCRPLSATNRMLLDAQNAERAALGLSPMRWNDILEDHATDYAEVLARTMELVHAPREGRGAERENLQRGLISWTPQEMIQDWAKEKANFLPGIFPNVARDGDWQSVAHYTQMVWPTTTDVGCGSAIGGGFRWFVCRYFPGGNKDGMSVGFAPSSATVASGAAAAATDAQRSRADSLVNRPFKDVVADVFTLDSGQYLDALNQLAAVQYPAYLQGIRNNALVENRLLSDAIDWAIAVKSTRQVVVGPSTSSWTLPTTFYDLCCDAPGSDILQDLGSSPEPLDPM